MIQVGEAPNFWPRIHTAPWMTPLPGAGPAPGVPGAAGATAPIPQLGLSPRRPAPAPAPRMAWTEPVTALQHTARAVTASGTSLTPSASSAWGLRRKMGRDAWNKWGETDKEPIH